MFQSDDNLDPNDRNAVYIPAIAPTLTFTTATTAPEPTAARFCGGRWRTSATPATPRARDTRLRTGSVRHRVGQ